MKKLFLIVLSVFCISTGYALSDHPIKLTSSEIKYDAKNKSIRIECKVFVDDFAPAVGIGLVPGNSQSNLTQDDVSRIEHYFLVKYRVSINDSTLPWKIQSYDISNNILSLVFLHTDINIKEGDDLTIENSLLFESFGDIQSNWMSINFAPFIGVLNFESTMDEYIYSHTF